MVGSSDVWENTNGAGGGGDCGEGVAADKVVDMHLGK